MDLEFIIEKCDHSIHYLHVEMRDCKAAECRVHYVETITKKQVQVWR